MKIHSFRWKLPISYAMIALVAAFALGVVLLMVLHGYYTGQERAYLENNARVISIIAGRTQENTLENAQDNERLKLRLRALAFISDTRIQLLDTDHAVLVDSGLPHQTYIEFAPVDPAVTPDSDVDVYLHAPDYVPDQDVQAMRLNPETSGDRIAPVSYLDPGPMTGDFVVTHLFRPPLVLNDVPLGFNARLSLVQAESLELAFGVSAAHTPFGFRVSEDPVSQIEDARRSNQVLDFTLYNENQDVIGYIRLLDGPAYGSEVVDRVAQTWLLASAVAVLLAVTVGWFVSRQISNPLLALTEMTRSMAAGDLSARTTMIRRDELGVLATTFNDMATRIENTVVTLRRFVANAAHELHTPLTALHTNLELISETASDTVVVSRALDQVRRLESLADDLLDLSRIEAEAMSGDIHPEPVDVIVLAHDIGEVYASRAEQQDIDFTLDMPSEALIVNGCPSQIQRLMSNLLDNAVKFTPAGGSVQFSLARVNGCVELVVQDTGIGILPDDLPFLFERFRRGRNTASYPGSGLGLTIVKAITDAHNGTAYVASWGSGTRVTVRLPVAEDKRPVHKSGQSR